MEITCFHPVKKKPRCSLNQLCTLPSWWLEWWMFVETPPSTTFHGKQTSGCQVWGWAVAILDVDHDIWSIVDGTTFLARRIKDHEWKGFLFWGGSKVKGAMYLPATKKFLEANKTLLVIVVRP